MIDINKLQQAFQQATKRAIKIHNALDIHYITGYIGQAVEMSDGKVIRVIEQQGNVQDDVDSTRRI